jgi:hypothetical protein
VEREFLGAVLVGLFEDLQEVVDEGVEFAGLLQGFGDELVVDG